ncbi:glycosyltransferase family 4 protein [Xanthovirga aplysinae]|uniref:glycosyltransferase family 4 protein n=1 Tax=Xanthovirga aplysinae TaxID=2529853 RepID=UPI0012BB5F87|nr:glycosyltransferase family 4 protein [Xanthovirga aplysinae]MTI32347.1 glycosyltransferase family 1 protein [Xanthovirga aplysinae]
MKILFLVPYPSEQAPSQRFRYEQYLEVLEASGHSYHIASFLNNKTWSILYKKGYNFLKFTGILKGFGNRLLMLFGIRNYDVVFIHREASPIGPPIFEWLIAKVFRKKIIYDFDDAIWLSNSSQQNKLAAKLKWHKKVDKICKWSYKISVGNDYLGDYARQFNPQVVFNPTTIDTENLHNQIKKQDGKKIVIGWTGTHSTMGYLKVLVPIIKKLEGKYDFEFSVISNQKPDLPLKSLTYKPWNKLTEIDDLLHFNIGVMPLTDDKWAKGKCGFKALQYMALGIPAIASPVGVNTTIISHGIDGYLCKNKEEWYLALEKLIKDEQLRIKVGKNSRKKVVEHYSILSNKNNFLRLFD